MAQKKILLGGVSVLAVGGAGAWMWMKGFWGNGEVKEQSDISLLWKPNGAEVRKQSMALETSTEIIQPVEPKEKEKETLDTPEETKLPQEEEHDVVTEESVVIDDPKKQIGEAGLDCEGADREIDCKVLEGGLNVDIDGEKKENYEIIGEDNGNLKFRISDDSIFNNDFRFIVTEKPIQLRSKTDSTQTLTLQRYENYGVEKVEDKVYLTRKLNVEEGKIKSLGLPRHCSLPTEVSTGSLIKPTCKLTKEQIKSVNFEEKKSGGATSGGEVDLYIQKVNDEETYRGGYKFTFHPPKAEVEINEKDKIKGGVFKDFRLKEPEADDLVLERVWKNEGDLLSKVELSCEENGKCTINEGALRIKDEKGVISIEDGRRKKSGGNGNIYLEKKNAAGYYEGLSFSVWGGEITIESKASAETTFKMEELGIFHIVKEEKDGASSFHLTRKKGGVEEMIRIYLGADQCSPIAGNLKECTGNKNHLKNYRFFDGEGESKVIADNDRIPIKITVTPNQIKRTYPLGYKFSIKPERPLKIGKITLKAGVDNNFKIKRDESVKKLYLVEDK